MEIIVVVERAGIVQAADVVAVIVTAGDAAAAIFLAGAKAQPVRKVPEVTLAPLVQWVPWVRQVLLERWD